MKTKNLILILVLGIVNSACISRSYYIKNHEHHVSTVNNNVCKRLKGKVVLYAIFVDSKYTNFWTNYDITTTIDSIQKSIHWIETKAQENGVDLEIELQYHKTKKQVVPIESNFYRKTLSATLFQKGLGVRNVDKWADKVGNIAIKIYGPDTTTVVKNKVIPKDRERLIARLRDVYQTDNVALMYFINNYHKDEISVAMHTASDVKTEYAIVSFKEPSVIAHEFLHLFGALDLYYHHYEHRFFHKNLKLKSTVQKDFPNEIMAVTHRTIDSLEISDLTKYLIGWNNTLDKKYKNLLLGKKWKIAQY